MALDQLQDLDELEGRLRRNLESIVADVIAILRSDIGTFAGREVRKRFESNVEFAETIDDDKLRELKVRVSELGTRVANETCDALTGDMDFWFGPDVPEGEGKSFEAHTAFIDKIQAIVGELDSLLGEFGFPDADEPLHYGPPAYFVGGKYAPGLAESFWKNLQQLNELRGAREQQDVGRRRAVQRHRWDTVDKKKK